MSRIEDLLVSRDGIRKAKAQLPTAFDLATWIRLRSFIRLAFTTKNGIPIGMPFFVRSGTALALTGMREKKKSTQRLVQLSFASTTFWCSKRDCFGCRYSYSYTSSSS
jgi:hypothetical protein